jgi:hypothetical protein
MRLARLAIVLACALGAFVLPGVASGAEDGDRAPLEPRFSLFFLEASNGYEAELATIGNQVFLETYRGEVAALYQVGGSVTDKRIEARFGRQGRISGRYERIDLFGGGDRDKDEPCEDPFSFVVLRGTISFRGEGGYTSVEARRAGGLLVDPAAARCRQRARARASARRDSRLNAYLTAISKQGSTVTSFTLARKRGRPWSWIEAERQERRGKMQIYRAASTTVGGENAVALSGPGVRPPFAFVAAPKPFTGSAVLDGSAPMGSQWSGSLTAWLPGLGKIGLTGPDYALSLCRRAGDEPGCDPEPLVRKELIGPQGSGSQSQLLAEARLSWSRYLRSSPRSTP